MLLDSKRLGKQRLEAQQIHEYILAIQAVYRFYLSHPKLDTTGVCRVCYVPVSRDEEKFSYVEQSRRFHQRCRWTKHVVTQYFLLDTQLITTASSTLNTTVSLKPRDYKCKKEDGEKPLLLKRHAYHPAVAMWMGYEDSLKLYFNECVKEWISRGYKNTRVLFDLPDEKNIVHPWWTKSTYLHNSHKSALLRKELVRNEKDWYWTIDPILKIRYTDYYALGYCWPSDLSASVIFLMMTRKDVPAGLVCATIKNDYVSQAPFLKDSEGYVIVKSYST